MMKKRKQFEGGRKEGKGGSEGGMGGLGGLGAWVVWQAVVSPPPLPFLFPSPPGTGKRKQPGSD